MKTFLLVIISFSFINISISQSGQLDPAFGNKGITTTNMGATSNNYSSYARQVLTNDKGSLFLLLNASFICKRLPNGTIDSTFGFNGYSKSVPITNGFAALQKDGKIVIAGTPLNGASFIVARLTAAGLPDSGFGKNGIQTTIFNGPSYATSLAIQVDGKIVVAGNTTDINGTYFALARYNTNGSADNTFNTNGKVVTDFLFKTAPVNGVDSVAVHNAFANTIAIQNDGKIVAAGYAFSGINNLFAMARYNTNGTPDNSFGVKGKQTSAIANSNATAYSMAIQNDNKIVLAGYVSNQDNTFNFIVARYKTNGSPDSSFNNSGNKIIPVSADNQIGNSIALQSNGKIVVAGYTLNTALHDIAVARLNEDGSADNSFDTDGIVTTDINGSDDYAGSVLLQNNKIVVAGYSINAVGLSNFTLIRYNENGSNDNSFIGQGKLLGQYQQGYTVFNASILQKDGKLVTAGQTWNGKDYDFAVVRYNSNGSLDGSFNATGKQITDFGADDIAVSIQIQADGKILVAGTSGTINGQFVVARYNINGSLDNSFNTSGKSSLAMGFADLLAGMYVQKDGKILLAGSTFKDTNYDLSYFAIGRLNSNGTPDKTFSTDGRQFVNFESSPSFASSIIAQKDGKILVAGRANIDGQNNFAIARFNVDGSLDNSFSSDGKQTNNFGSHDYFGQALALETNGNILLAGYDQSNNGNTNLWSLLCYLPNGNIDYSFGKNGYQITDMGSTLSESKAIAVSADGTIAVGGGNNDFAIVVYKKEGTPDSSFGTNGKLITPVGIETSAIHSLCFNNNKLWAAGRANFPGTVGVAARYLFTQSNSSPVTIIDFKGIPQNKSVLLQWQTSMEKGLADFTVQHSEDGVQFTTIGLVPAKGNSIANQSYSSKDERPVSGNNYYRLRMSDADGNCIFSKVILVVITAEACGIKIYPNPVMDILYIKSNGENEKIELIISDGCGKKMKVFQVDLLDNIAKKISVQNLPRGLYNVQIVTKNSSETRILVKQ